MGKKRIPSIESDQQLSIMSSKQSIHGNGKSIPTNGESIPGNGKSIPGNVKSIPGNGESILWNEKSIPVKSIYEDFCLTHPNVAESIFDKLDNKSLIKCRKVSRVLKTFLTDPTIILMRKFEETVGNQDQFAKLWKPILKSLSADNLKQLELAMNLFYSGKDICRY